MAYKAIIDIGEFKKGDIVPDIQAIKWQEMYKVSPVEHVSDVHSSQEEKEPSGVSDSESLKDDFKKKLLALDGIGKKTAEDILKEFSSVNEIEEFMSKPGAEDDLPFRDDVCEILMEEFGPPKALEE